MSQCHAEVCDILSGKKQLNVIHGRSVMCHRGKVMDQGIRSH